MAERLLARREWTEDCRVSQHRDCVHIGAASTIGLLGHRRFVTICGCPCHWGCPSEEVDFSRTSAACICPTNGESRQQNFETFAPRSAVRRLLHRRRQDVRHAGP